MNKWNSMQYLKFKNERTQPAIDLAKKIEHKNPKSIIDIGCGPGNSTAVLKENFKNAEILGIDSSEDMINKAKSEYDYLNFMLLDVQDDLKNIVRKFDVVFSNACIQWVPNHRNLIKRLMDLLNTGGVLAVQIPYNYEQPVHKIISEVSKRNKWKNKFKVRRPMYVLNENEYFDLLSEISDNFSIWLTTYFHRMKSYEDLIEWYRGTGLRPYLELLDDSEKKEFENEILLEIKRSYPLQKNGEIIFKFPRLFFTVEKND
ncbi:MAG: methyltransferase domain-containing protein [Ruminococcus sp.]